MKHDLHETMWCAIAIVSASKSEKDDLILAHK